MPRIVAISDTHTLHDKVIIPECDILIHAGDWTFQGERAEVRDFCKWLDKQPAKEIVIIPGNHEKIWERCLPESKSWITEDCPRAHLLMESSVELFNLKIWGSGYTPAFGYGWAFNAGRDPVEAAHIFKPFIGDIWATIDNDVDILVTHGMPEYSLDSVWDRNNNEWKSVGDAELAKRISQLKNLKHYIGGHLHAEGGKTEHVQNVWYHNASVCNESYKVVNRPIEFDL